MEGEAAIELYRSEDGTVTIPVRVDGGTVWAAQAQMADLFGVDRDSVGAHLKNAFADSELDRAATAEDFSVVRREGARDVCRTVTHYNLDAIISVGYRVHSPEGVHFRKWATSVLRERILDLFPDDAEPSSPVSTREAFIERSRSGYTKLRHEFVQVPASSTGGAASPAMLPIFARNHRAAVLYLALLTNWPWLGRSGEALAADTWIRFLSSDKTGSLTWTAQSLSHAWKVLEDAKLVERTLVNRLKKVAPLRESGSGEPHTFPDGDAGGLYVGLSHTFWTDELSRDAQLAGTGGPAHPAEGDERSPVSGAPPGQGREVLRHLSDHRRSRPRRAARQGTAPQR